MVLGISPSTPAGGIQTQASRGGTTLIFRLFSDPKRSCFTVRYPEANRLPYFPPLICNVSTGSRLRYSHHPRDSRPQRCFNRSGLYSRLKPRRSRRSKPYRQDGVYPFSLFSEDRPNLLAVYFSGRYL